MLLHLSPAARILSENPAINHFYQISSTFFSDFVFEIPYSRRQRKRSFG